jgi:hypothetical protein
MASVLAKDISKWQGNWQDTGEPIVLIKISGGDNGLYYDTKATENWNGAVAAGRAVGGYHFAGWTNPSAEANYFMQGMRPLVENDGYALDIEAIPAGFDPVSWSDSFTRTIHDTIGVWPLAYMNFATLNAYDWSPVLANCGLWLADWNNDPEGTIPTLHTYVMQQYSDGPNYDHDEWFGTLDQFKAYGWHAPQVTPPQEVPSEPAPVQAPVEQPAPIVPTTPDPVVSQSPTQPDQLPTPATGQQPTPPLGTQSDPITETPSAPTPPTQSSVTVSPEPKQRSFLKMILDLIISFFKR